MGEYLNIQSSNLLSLSEQILAKSMRAGAEAADRILRQARAALEILTCAWDDCNERATMRCPWCHQVPYCRLEHRDLNFDLHGVSAGLEQCTGRVAQLVVEEKREPGQHR